MKKFFFCAFILLMIVFLVSTVSLLLLAHDYDLFDDDVGIWGSAYAIFLVFLIWFGHVFFKYKQVLLAFVLILIVISCLFPPWQDIYQEYRGGIKNCKPAGYGFIVVPPDCANFIDFGRLGLQIGLLVFIGCCVRYSGYIFHQEK
ncbi:MAG: hypothetical protein A2Y10_19685 [Planctomycetes bacterium GWF2_41_51]|nr:MAG: hypothetical protein A2Y10_19685 [Planctomycetes bacterium GWF2_41_51]HBG28202.1 hypothetical protein [Phycisphaerales bacterium]